MVVPDDAHSDPDPASLTGMLVVDAANVVGSRPDGWWRDRAGAARRLVESLDGLAAQGMERLAGDGAQVTVVLEGAARRGAEPRATAPVRVVHAGGSGDDAIVDVVAAALEQDEHASVTVVTSDRGLRRRVEALGARTRGPQWLRGMFRGHQA